MFSFIPEALKSLLLYAKEENQMAAVSLNDVCYSQNKCCCSSHLVKSEYFKPNLPSVNFLALKISYCRERGVGANPLPSRDPSAPVLTGAGISSCQYTSKVHLPCNCRWRSSALLRLHSPRSSSPAKPGCPRAAPPSPAHCS